VVFDKTGTITIRQKGSVVFSGNEIYAEQLLALVNVARQSLHSLSKTFASAHHKIGQEQVVGFTENPGTGVYGMVNGLAVELKNPKHLTEEEQVRFNAWNPENPGMGRTAVLVNGKLYARLDFVTSYRDGLKSVVSKLKNAFGLSLLSGDNDTEASALSNELIAGFDFKEMHFEMDPHQKRGWVEQKQSDSETKVLMVGDGLNDAGALREAHFGVSIAEDNSQFTPASDGILTASSFQKLPELIELSQKARSVVIGAFVLSLLYNVIGISVAVQGLLSPVMAAILMPLSSVSIVVFTTVATTIISKRKLA
jgi:Cu+-exporting ATPase